MQITDAVTLAGQRVRLEPLRREDASGLAEAVGELGSLWYTMIPSAEGMAADVDRRLAARDAGTLVPFVQRRTSDGVIVGLTCLMNIDQAVPRAEIGGTWLASRAQRTGINTEAKLLLLEHLFEACGCVRVELKTHALNTQSRRAIERIGASFEGILRQHMRLPNGLLRDTAMYAITDYDWPTVRAHLRHLLGR